MKFGVMEWNEILWWNEIFDIHIGKDWASVYQKNNTLKSLVWSQHKYIKFNIIYHLWSKNKIPVFFQYHSVLKFWDLVPQTFLKRLRLFAIATDPLVIVQRTTALIQTSIICLSVCSYVLLLEMFKFIWNLVFKLPIDHLRRKYTKYYE